MPSTSLASSNYISFHRLASRAELRERSSSYSSTLLKALEIVRRRCVVYVDETLYLFLTHGTGVDRQQIVIGEDVGAVEDVQNAIRIEVLYEFVAIFSRNVLMFFGHQLFYYHPG